MKLRCIITFLLLFAAFGQHVAASETDSKERFQKVDEAIVIDSQTGLMWASHDNGGDIDWYDAEYYCKNYSAGGYTDWRLPNIKELATLYTEDRENKDGYFIVDSITITDCCPWSSDTNMGGAAAFSFKTGKKPPASLGESYQLRALPVRSAGKMGMQAK